MARWIRPSFGAGFLAAMVVLLGACGEAISPDQRVLLERQKFTAELTSWAPVEGDQLALDVVVQVRGSSSLQFLTVEVHQVGASEAPVRVDCVALDVAGMAFDGRKTLTASVLKGEGVEAVAVLLQPVPEAARRSEYREFSD